MNLITKLQELPYETRVKIMWSAVLIIGIVVVIVWIIGLKSAISNIGGVDIAKLTEQTKNTPVTQTTFASVERIEQTDKILKIYFNFNNSSNDILNVSKLEDIGLMANNQTIKAQKNSDRQGNPFVQKILSHTQNFGILVFPGVNSKTATLTFDQMYFEQNPSNIFQQKLDLNLEQLNQSSKVRN